MIGTPLLAVFEKFLAQVDNKEWLMVQPEIIEDLMIHYLEKATVDFSLCKKDLSFSYPERDEKTFDMDGNTTSIFLEVGQESTIIYGITGKNSKEEYEYEEDIIENGITITFDESPNEPIIVRFATEGYFPESLDLEEMQILISGMILTYVEMFLTHQDSLKQYVTDKDFTKLSGANMLLRLMGLQKLHEKKFNVAHSRYAFRDFEGWS